MPMFRNKCTTNTKWRLKRISILIVTLVALVVLYACYRLIAPSLQRDTWVHDLGFAQEEVHPLTFHFTGERSCPQVVIAAGNKEYNIIFDTGCSIGLLLTDLVEDKIPHTLLSQVESVNMDGSHRGWMKKIRIDEISVYQAAYEDIEAAIADWKMISSAEFNGNIGLAYFKNKAIALDYLGGKIAVSNRPIDYTKLDDTKYTVLPLLHSTDNGLWDLPFFQAEWNGESVMVFLDTGKNYSFVQNPDCSFSSVGPPAGFTDISIKIGKMVLALKDMAQINDMSQAEGLPYPLRIELNSDQIIKNKLFVTLDLISQKIIFCKQ